MWDFGILWFYNSGIEVKKEVNNPYPPPPPPPHRHRGLSGQDLPQLLDVFQTIGRAKIGTERSIVEYAVRIYVVPDTLDGVQGRSGPWCVWSEYLNLQSWARNLLALPVGKFQMVQSLPTKHWRVVWDLLICLVMARGGLMPVCLWKQGQLGEEGWGLGLRDSIFRGKAIFVLGVSWRLHSSLM